MASFRVGWGTTLLVFAIVLVVLPSGAQAFGAGNIPSIAQVEGHNWRHGGSFIRSEGRTGPNPGHRH